MTDSTPVNYYLLFDTSDEFETQDKILYALDEDPDHSRANNRACSLEETLRRKILIRSLDELKRGKFGDIGFHSPTSEKSFTDDGFSEGGPSATSMRDAMSMYLGTVDTIDGKPWENAEGAVNEWDWPLEILYQNYHLHLVIDFARTFDVSRNGTVFFDRIPDVVQSVINAMRTTLKQRSNEKEKITKWLSNTALAKDTQTAILQQIWDPHVLVSITLINVPWQADGEVRLKDAQQQKMYRKAARRDLVPPDVKIFSSQDTSKMSSIPILARAEAQGLVDDPSFVEKLESTLAAYERASRNVAPTSSMLSLESAIEYLVRSAPNTSKYCESTVLIANVRTCSCSSAISFLEGMVRRKNIILSIVALNLDQVLDSPQLSSLTHFIYRIGGFIVGIDYWRALSHPQLNAEWAQRFEGSRCLVQQLFVQLVNRFPHRSKGPWERTGSNRLLMYGNDRGLAPKNCRDYAMTLAVLQSIAVARFNENWSVLIDNRPNEETVHLLARNTHFFHQGALTLEYELFISPQTFYRSVHVMGTKTLVDTFRRVDMEELSRKQNSQGRVNWVTHIESFRLHLHEGLHGEEIMLQLMLENAYAQSLSEFSNSSGVLYKWLNFSAVRSIAVFYDISNGRDYSIIPARSSINRNDQVGVNGTVGSGGFAFTSSPVVSSIEKAMLQHSYIRLSTEGQELAFLRQKEGYLPYLVQFFPLRVKEEHDYKDYPAGCFECRISFFFCGWVKRAEEVRHLIKILTTATSTNSTLEPRSARPLRGADKSAPVGLRAYSHKESQCAFGVIFELTSPKFELPTVHLSRPMTLTASNEVPMRIPYPSIPFVLKKAFTFHWSFSGRNLYLRKKFFFFAVLRRQETFNCLVSLGDSLKAILHRKKQEDEKGSQFDCIDASTSVSGRVELTRIITCMTPRSFEMLREDVKQDEKIFSALYTFFKKVSPKPKSKNVTSAHETSYMRIEALLPYISPDCTEIIKIPSPAYLGVEGVRLLRQRLNEYLVGLDSSQTVDSHHFVASFVSLLTSSRWSSTSNNQMPSKCVVSTKVVVSTNPVQNGSIVFALMVADDLGTGVTANRVELALSWMNFERLSQELMSRYQRQEITSHNRKEWKADNMANSKLLQELKVALAVRASIHSTTRLIETFVEEEKKREAEAKKDPNCTLKPRRLEDSVVKDIMDATSNLAIFVHDIEVTPLLYVVECLSHSAAKEAGENTSESEAVKKMFLVLKESLTSVLGNIGISFDPLPSLCFPREETLALSQSNPETSSIPVILKCAAIMKKREEKDEKFWVSGVKSNIVSVSVQERPWSDTGILSGTRERGSLSSRSLHLRLFMLSSMFENEKYERKFHTNLPTSTIRQLLAEKPPEPDLFTSRAPFIQLENVNKASLVAMKLHRLVEVVRDEMLQFCLRNSFHHISYLDLRKIVKEGSPASEGGNPTQATEKKLSLLSQYSPHICERMTKVTGLQTLLNRIVIPCLFATTRLARRTDRLEYTQQSTVTAVDPLEDVKGVFQRSASEDSIMVLPIKEGTRHIYIPNAAVSTPMWILIDLEFPSVDGGHLKVYWYQLERSSSGETAASKLCATLIDYIKKRMTQVCQLRLLKELRHFQKATDTLLPERLGNQFTLDAHERQIQLRKSRRGAALAPSVPLQLHGKHILDIPLYYKLQNQCSRVLIFIERQCPRLELVPIYNQRQCFIVADDLVDNVFHCIRLLFLPLSEECVLPTELSPPLNSADRCSRLVVHLFSATDNPSINRPLEKLRSFCYFMAVQELQGQLNYTAKLSFNDSLFLQHQRVEPLLMPYGKCARLPEAVTTATATAGSSPESKSSSAPSVELSNKTNEVDGNVALAFIVLHLREYNYKYFELTDEEYQTTSDFVTHYSLCAQRDSSQLSSNGEDKKLKQRVWRFVKLMEEVKDVLVSCTVYLDKNRQCVVLQPFLTKEPMERYTGGESEATILSELQRYVEDTNIQIDFYARLRQRGKRIPIEALSSAVDELLSVNTPMHLKESMVLRHKVFSLRDISTATLPYLLERLCGALFALNPCCFQYPVEDELNYSEEEEQTNENNSNIPVFLSSFPWQWMEGVQNNPLADCMSFCVVCGFQVILDNGQVAPVTRAVPHILENLTVSTNKADESKEGILKPLGLNSRMDWKIVVKMSMATEELSIAIFNLRDADVLLKVVGQIIDSFGTKSNLLQDILLQRLGVMPNESLFSESDLALHCCGDSSNVIENRKLFIDSQVYRRPAKNLRFPSCAVLPPTSLEERFVIMVEGLHNRGLVVNHVFPVEDGTKVLFDELLDLTLVQCEQCMKQFFQAGFLEWDPTASLQPQVTLPKKGMLAPSNPMRHRPTERTKCVNCRIVYRRRKNWFGGALIACVCHRHMFVSHVIVESQNARSSVMDILAKCESLLQNNRDAKDMHELTNCILLLQSKSKQIYGTRVPDFLLFHENAKNRDDVLEQTLPERTEKNTKHAVAVDNMLKNFTVHLLRVCPGSKLIDLDPSSEYTLSQQVLVNRLRCRYGKVCTHDGEVVRFCPHLYFAVIPLFNLLCQSRQHQVEAIDFLKEVKASPIVSCGVFIVEVGFQVAHYALDIFAVKGRTIPPSTVAKLAAELKERLCFESMLYDHQVRHIMYRLRHGMPPLPGHQPLAQALTTLTSHYPSAPLEARTVASSYQINDSLMIRMETDPADSAEKTRTTAVDSSVTLLPDKDENSLITSITKQVYRFCGIATWKSREQTDQARGKKQLLLILLEPGSDIGYPGPLHPEELHRFLRSAKKRLVRLLHRTTHQERLDSAWRKFVSRLDPISLPIAPFRGLSNPAALANATALPNLDEYYLLVADSIKVFLPRALQAIRLQMEAVDWPTSPMQLLQPIVEHCYSSHVVHVAMRTARDEKNSTDQSHAVFPEDGMHDRRSHSMRRVVFTLSVLHDQNSFLSAEGWSHLSLWDSTTAIELEEVSIVRRPVNATANPSAAVMTLPMNPATRVAGLRAALTKQEKDLVETFQSILTRAMWASALWGTL